MLAMVRTQIQLTEEQAAGLKRLAAERGVSMAEVVRDAVEQALAADEIAARRARALAVVGKFRDREGKTDVAERHDDYLAEAFYYWHDK
jgi:Arc/MetJ-type ribon-helix-helix transcriptional regulator